MVFSKRMSGILLHPTSLPGEYGIGDLGNSAYEFVDFLNKAKQNAWQILPLNPVGYGYSPYQSYSAYAGNHLLISIDKLYEEGLLSREELLNCPVFKKGKVDFLKAENFKENLFRKAFTRFKEDIEYKEFKEENKSWLKDYSLFMVLKKYFKGKSWPLWDEPLKNRNKEALKYIEIDLKDEIQYNIFLQFKFFNQWKELKNYASQKDIKIIGDIPIFVSYDSCDVWANPNLFNLDKEGNPKSVAGVPPDYFSKTGQLWGNPHYNWEEMKKDDYSWWRKRFEVLFNLVDIVRIDHFRGFEAYWEIPYGEKTAVKGRWVKGPGEHFFQTLHKYLGKLPVIAEDLGFITPEVKKLKNKFKFPGMQILHFILEDESQKISLPLRFEENSVVYTGTHDNDTTLGWFKKHQLNKTKVFKRLNNIIDSNESICWNLIKIAYQSNGIMVIIPLQDILCLDSYARMNYPGTVNGNWEWRYKREELTEEIIKKLRSMVEKYI